MVLRYVNLFYRTLCVSAYVFMKAILASTIIIAISHTLFLLLALFFNQTFYDNIMLIEQPWCHQTASRSFCFKGIQMPLCARCCGIMISLSSSLFVASKFPKGKYIYVIILFVSFFDILLKRFGIDSSNEWRFIAGLSLGFLFYNFVEFIIKSLKSNLSCFFLSYQL